MGGRITDGWTDHGWVDGSRMGGSRMDGWRLQPSRARVGDGEVDATQAADRRGPMGRAQRERALHCSIAASQQSRGPDSVSYIRHAEQIDRVYADITCRYTQWGRGNRSTALISGRQLWFGCPPCPLHKPNPRHQIKTQHCKGGEKKKKQIIIIVKKE